MLLIDNVVWTLHTSLPPTYRATATRRYKTTRGGYCVLYRTTAHCCVAEPMFLHYPYWLYSNQYSRAQTKSQQGIKHIAYILIVNVLSIWLSLKSDKFDLVVARSAAELSALANW